jgi:predicted alpha/beta hydrolase
VILATTTDGVALGAVHLPATGPRVGAALCLHAMMVDHRSFRPGRNGLPDRLAAAGFDVWVADLRGRGLSPCDVPWGYDDLADRDLPALVAALPRPLLIVGHSLGGHVAMASAARADAYALIATNVWRPSLEPGRRRRLAKAAAMNGFLALTRARGRFPARRLRMGPVDEPRAYVEDLVRFWREDRWAGTRDFTATLPEVKAPVLSILGAGDRLMGHHVAARRWIAPVPGAEVRVVGRATGLPWDPTHMGLVTDARSSAVWDDIAAWARTRLGA